MSKVCRNCGNELNEGAKFCPKCGKKVINESKAMKEVIEKAIDGKKIKETIGKAIDSIDGDKIKENIGKAIDSDKIKETIEKAKSINFEKKEEKKDMSKVCEKCGNELKDSAKFCTKCGEKVKEETESTANIENEKATIDETVTDRETAESNNQEFHFEKRKMIGMWVYKDTDTTATVNDNKLSIRQTIKKIFRKSKTVDKDIIKSNIDSAEVKTKMDTIDMIYVGAFTLSFLVTWNVGLLVPIAVFLWTAYGKVINIKMKNGEIFSVPTSSLDDNAKLFLENLR